MRRTLVLLAAALITAPAGAQEPADSIEWAIREGARTKKCEQWSAGVSRWRANSFAPHEFRVYLSGPLNRVQCRAASIANAFKVPTRADLTEMDTLRVIAVRLVPFPDVETRPDRAEISNIVLTWKGKDGDVVLQPDSIIAVVDTSRNLKGSQIPFTIRTALFNLDRRPPSGFKIRIAIPNWNVSADVGRSDLAKIH